MIDLPASDRYRIVIDEAKPPKRWFRLLGVLIANVAAWFDGFGAGPTNPGGRTIRVIDTSTRDVVLEFVEGFGDDAQQSLAMLQDDVESQCVDAFRTKWL